MKTARWPVTFAAWIVGALGGTAAWHLLLAALRWLDRDIGAAPLLTFGVSIVGGLGATVVFQLLLALPRWVDRGFETAQVITEAIRLTVPIACALFLARWARTPALPAIAHGISGGCLYLYRRRILQEAAAFTSSAAIATLAGAVLSSYLSIYTFLGHYPHRVPVRPLLPYFTCCVYVVYFSLVVGRKGAATQRLLGLIFLLSTVIAATGYLKNFVVLPYDVGQPPWQPISHRLEVAVVMWSGIVLCIYVLQRAFDRLTLRHAFLLAAAIQSSMAPFIRPWWGYH